jgi:hydrogenase expression/formation protein HypE
MDKVVQLGHGGGGILQSDLIRFITETIQYRQISQGVGIDAMDDGATIPLPQSDLEIVVTADGHTVDPLSFPGGDLGTLAVSGTINDLLMMGAQPIALTSVVIVEEGLSFKTLKLIMDSFNDTANRAGIAIIAGDTKVMPHGTLKEMVLVTSGIGLKPKSRQILDSNCKPGAKIILTGTIGDHTACLIAHRDHLSIDPPLHSDIAPLLPLYSLIETYPRIYAMKDPTRGGVAAALNEWAEKSNVEILIDETALLIPREVRSIADLYGLDPLEFANEGKALICIDAQDADAFLAELRATSIGVHAQIIGEVGQTHPKFVILRTSLGGSRIIEKPMGELIPRIC